MINLILQIMSIIIINTDTRSFLYNVIFYTILYCMYVNCIPWHIFHKYINQSINNCWYFLHCSAPVRGYTRMASVLQWKLELFSQALNVKIIGLNFKSLTNCQVTYNVSYALKLLTYWTSDTLVYAIYE